VKVEPRRDSRRLQSLRGWGHGQTEQVFPRGAEPGGADGQYWAFANDRWDVSAGYNGPWVVVNPEFVPRPILIVPVQYYHSPPGHWKQWERGRPPHWHEDWGPEWADKREWKRRDRNDDDRDDRRGKGKGKGPGRD
jgi:hypothetical protein